MSFKMTSPTKECLKVLLFVTWNVLWEVIYWCSACLQGGYLTGLCVFGNTCLIGAHVLLGDMSY